MEIKRDGRGKWKKNANICKNKKEIKRKESERKKMKKLVKGSLGAKERKNWMEGGTN